MKTNTKPLTIYKASAGSGKTFTLVVEYLCLLVQNPTCHDQILAVTFTNKATEEMKMRIISQLYGISKGLPSSDNYLRVIAERTQQPETDIRSQCTTALYHILHHYNNFHIQTIDAFFQTVFRNMARELDLPPNLRIDLNDIEVEQKAVDELINSLDTNSQVLSWIREYISANMQEDQGWNVINEIKKFGQNIFKDFYKNNEESLNRILSNNDFFSQLRRKLVLDRNNAQTEWSKHANALYDLLERNGYNHLEYYKYGKSGSVCAYICKLYNSDIELSPTPSRVQAFIDDPLSMVKVDIAGDSINDFAANVLQPAIKEFEDNKHKWWKTYQSARLTLRNLNQLRLLYAIDSKVKSMNEEANRFQLSNTQSLLKSFIHDSDSPFIYEKIGSFLRYIMIDEFQDTSRMQWNNFKVLLLDNLADKHSHNLIVGDVKQSIYRWRGGDWQLLNNIKEEFTTSSQGWEDYIKEITLDHNHRSSEKIVLFNNAFFDRAVEQTLVELKNDNIDDYEQLQRAYNGHSQKPSKLDGKGFVSINLLGSSSNEYRDEMLGRILDHVDTLISRGVKDSDIAILVRSNSHILTIADMFMRERPNINIVSGEAFRLDASPAVNILVDALRLLVNPDDDLTRNTLAKNYVRSVLEQDADDNDIFLSDDVNALLPQQYREDKSLANMPLTDLVSTLYNIFSLDRLPSQSAYICRFNDVLSEYVFDDTSDIHGFLKSWDETLHTQKIQSDVVNGIRLLSIHKSKGLEFKHVIVPFCDWKLEQEDTLWCENVEGDPYCQLPIIPVQSSKKKMTGTVFESQYKKEHLQTVVDNMNLLYVAFTRAEESLLVIGKKSGDDKKKNAKATASPNNRSFIIEQVIRLLPEQLDGSTLIDDESALTLQWGEMPTKPVNTARHDDKGQHNIFEQSETPYPITPHTYPSTVSFRQSNKSREFVSTIDDDPLSSSTNYIQMGNVLHNLFAHIRAENDIEPQLRSLELEGILYDDDLTPDTVRKKIRKSMETPLVREWFQEGWTLFNECTILVADPVTHKMKEYRPDRVMTNGDVTIVVDFKFGAPHPEYSNQVLNYMQLIRQMGHANVKGYLWYVMRNKVEEVKN